MQRGYTQGIAVFADETSKLLVNRGSNEVVNITSTEIMKNWFAGSMCSVIARSHRVPPLAGPMTGSTTKQSSSEPWIASRSLSSGGALRRPVGSQ